MLRLSIDTTRTQIKCPATCQPESECNFQMLILMPITFSNSHTQPLHPPAHQCLLNSSLHLHIFCHCLPTTTSNICTNHPWVPLHPFVFYHGSNNTSSSTRDQSGTEEGTEGCWHRCCSQNLIKQCNECGSKCGILPKILTQYERFHITCN